MKKLGTLNVQLSAVIASLGHGDRLVVCDSGLPIPRDAELVDLALAPGVPRFLEAVRVVLEELHVEAAIVAEEMVEANRDAFEGVNALLAAVAMEQVPHDQFKALTRLPEVAAFVRTGEATPFANVILVSGVTFS